jgi:hypothetical protein
MYKADGGQRGEFFVKYTRYVGSRMDAQDLICAPCAQASYVHRISPLTGKPSEDLRACIRDGQLYYAELLLLLLVFIRSIPHIIVTLLGFLALPAIARRL